MDEQLSLIIENKLEISDNPEETENPVSGKMCSRDIKNEDNETLDGRSSKWLDPYTILERFSPLLSKYERKEILMFSKIFFRIGLISSKHLW